jgi:AraC family transcriptional regulator
MAVNGVTLRLLPRGAYSVRYTPAQPVAGFAFESQHGVHAFGSDRVRAFRAGAHGMAFTPAGCSVFSEAAEGGEYLTLAGDPERLAAFGDDDGPCRLPRDQFTGRVDRGGVRAAIGLRRILLSGSADPAEIETALALFIAALRTVAGSTRPSLLTARSLTPQRLKAVEDQIEARLAEPLAVSDMAAACGLSTGFFLRAFTAAVGQTPHQYLTGRRVAAARRLLHRTGTGLAEIAVQTGFCSQAHMTVCFRKHVGVTPGTYRTSVTRG